MFFAFVQFIVDLLHFQYTVLVALIKHVFSYINARCTYVIYLFTCFYLVNNNLFLLEVFHYSQLVLIQSNFFNLTLFVF
jgi:hypothetical protein